MEQEVVSEIAVQREDGGEVDLEDLIPCVVGKEVGWVPALDAGGADEDVHFVAGGGEGGD